MTLGKAKQNSIVSRTIDFVVLGCTFYASCLLLSIPVTNNTVIHSLLYATVILVSVRLGRRFLSSAFASINSVVKLMLCNATGLVAGATIMLVVGSMIPEFGDVAVAVVFASVMAFFVLGTISPLLKRSAHASRHDRITS